MHGARYAGSEFSFIAVGVHHLPLLLVHWMAPKTGRPLGLARLPPAQRLCPACAWLLRADKVHEHCRGQILGPCCMSTQGKRDAKNLDTRPSLAGKPVPLVLRRIMWLDASREEDPAGPPTRHSQWMQMKNSLLVQAGAGWCRRNLQSQAHSASSLITWQHTLRRHGAPAAASMSLSC